MLKYGRLRSTRSTMDKKVKDYLKVIKRIEEGQYNIKFNLENPSEDSVEVVSTLDDGYLMLTLLVNEKKMLGYGSFILIDSDYSKTLRIFSEDVIDKLYSMGYKLT